MSLIRLPPAPLSFVPRPFQVVKPLLIRVIPARQFPFIEIIRRIGIAELGVLVHILFRLIVRVLRLIVRACIGVPAFFAFVRSHDNCFLQFAQNAGRIRNGTSFA